MLPNFFHTQHLTITLKLLGQSNGGIDREYKACLKQILRNVKGNRR